MAKDPAFLFYPSDWGGGTMTMSRFIKGCYIDLLMAQFNSGPLSLEEIKTVLGNDFAAWGTLSKKFKMTEQGLFFNERLEAEKNKRKAFTESRRENKSKSLSKTSYDKTYEPHMISHMENENRNGISLGKSENLFFELTTSEIQNTIEYVDRVAQKKHSPEKITSLWQSFKIQYSTEYYPGRNKVIQHFRDWLKKQPKVSNEASTQRMRNQL